MRWREGIGSACVSVAALGGMLCAYLIFDRGWGVWYFGFESRRDWDAYMAYGKRIQLLAVVSFGLAVAGGVGALLLSHKKRRPGRRED